MFGGKETSLDLRGIKLHICGNDVMYAIEFLIVKLSRLFCARSVTCQTALFFPV